VVEGQKKAGLKSLGRLGENVKLLGLGGLFSLDRGRLQVQKTFKKGKAGSEKKTPEIVRSLESGDGPPSKDARRGRTV